MNLNEMHKIADSNISRAFELGLGSDLISLLNNKGFFIKPASVHGHHGAEPGGLFAHCLEVYRNLKNFTERMDLKWSRHLSPAVIAMLHDICKCENYVWDRESEMFVYRQGMYPGHGEASVMIINAHGIRLTPEEIMCIRYHMGAYEKDNWPSLQAAEEKYPNIMWTQLADLMAARAGK